MKRVLLFIGTNIAVMLVLSVVFTLICTLIGNSGHGAISNSGQDYLILMIFSLVFGMGGALISLLISKPMAKFATRARTIDGTEGQEERWLIDTVGSLASMANIAMPEVAVYPGSANAFATGAFKNHALVAVSTDIMKQMTREELRAVLGHEISHVANGDMVTLTLVQGVLNACVIFLSRVLAYAIEGALSGGKDRRRGSGGLYFIIMYGLQLLLGVLASILVCAYSRHREFAADSGSAKLLGSPVSMISALRRLGNLRPGVLPDSLKAMGVSGKNATNLFSTHPPLEARIAALESFRG